MSGIVKGVGKVVGNLLGMPDAGDFQTPSIIMPAQAPAVAPVAPPPQAQAASMPDQSFIREDRDRSRRAAAGGGTGSSTMLTGPGGIDPSKLLVGKTSLLGM